MKPGIPPENAAAPSRPWDPRQVPLRDRADPYDAITDLFLGETEASIGTTGSMAPASHQPLPVPPLPTLGVSPRRPSSAPPAQSPADVVIRGSAPQALRPAPTRAPAPGPTPDNRHERGPARPIRAPKTAQIEAIILGHLPVLANAWAAEYARRIAAAENTPIAYLKFRSGEATIELVDPRPHARDDRGAAQLPDRKPHSIAEAVRSVARRTDRWIVRLESAGEPGLRDIAGIDSITVLTSVDDVAVVGAYRAIKDLCAPATDSQAIPRLRVSLMGAQPESAKTAAEKLTGAVAAFMGRSVEIGAPVERIDGGPPATPIYSGDPAMDFRSLLAMIRMGTLARGEPRSTPAAAKAGENNPPGTSSASNRGVPAPPPRDAGRRPGAAPLAAYVPGVTTLTARCPFAREVELGIDTTGAIHLFAKVEDPKNDAGPVKSLLVAATWLAEHAGLIGLTLPDGASLNPDSKPISHLLVEDPRAVARLLRTGLRVHLLTKGQAAEIG